MPDVTAYRPAEDELAQLRTEVRMLRSAHDDLAWLWGLMVPEHDWGVPLLGWLVQPVLPEPKKR